jgi:hypothetical protein
VKVLRINSGLAVIEGISNELFCDKNMRRTLRPALDSLGQTCSVVCFHSLAGDAVVYNYKYSLYANLDIRKYSSWSATVHF